MFSQLDMDAFVIGGNSSYFLLDTSSYLILVCIVENLMNGGNWKEGSFHCVSLIASFSLKVSGNSLQAFPPLKNGKHKDNLKKNMKGKV